MNYKEDTQSMVIRLVQADFNSDYAPTKKQPLDFSNSENPWGHADSVNVELFRCFDRLSHYPKREYEALLTALTEEHQLPKQNFFVGNGAAGCIESAVISFTGKGNQVILPELSFPLPIFTATTMGGCGARAAVFDNLRINFDALLKSVNGTTSLIFICNPNNPTGLYEDPDTIISFAKKVTVPVLVSEAAIEYAGSSLLESWNGCPENLVVVRSFSKVHGLAGLRVGYGIARPKLVERIKRLQLPFAISCLSETAAIAALKDKEHVHRSVGLMGMEREFISHQLEQLGFSLVKSDSNMLLARLPYDIDNMDDFISYLEKTGITILNGTAFSPILEGFVRISPRKRALNMVLIEAIRNFIKAK